MTESSREWVSIRQASQLLGVHIGTIREWADAGIIPSYRTPGGHRRFCTTDLHGFLRKQQLKSPSRTNPPSTEHALGFIRQELRAQPTAFSDWYQHMSVLPTPEQRAAQREIGQRLLGCVVSFVEEPHRREFLVDDGRRIAREYGRFIAATGLSAGNAARATIYFRHLILKSVLEAHIGSRTGDEEDARLFQRLSMFVDEILLAILDAYE